MSAMPWAASLILMSPLGARKLHSVVNKSCRAEEIHKIIVDKLIYPLLKCSHIEPRWLKSLYHIDK